MKIIPLNSIYNNFRENMTAMTAMANKHFRLIPEIAGSPIIELCMKK